MSKTLVILAAGMGSRYGGLKQMEPVGPSGEFICDYSIYDALRAGFRNVVFVIRKEMEETFDSMVGSRLHARVPVEYVYQEIFNLPEGVFVQLGRKKPWGTGHAVLVCKNAINGPFAVINADDLYGREAFSLIGSFLDETASDSNSYGMVGYRLKDTLSSKGTVARGVCQIKGENILEGIVERHQMAPMEGQVRYEIEPGRVGFLSGNEMVSMNLWGFKKSIFEHLDSDFRGFIMSSAKSMDAEFMLPTVIQNLLAQRKAQVRVMRSQCSWCGITNPDDKPLLLAHIRKLIEAGEYPANLWE